MYVFTHKKTKYEKKIVISPFETNTIHIMGYFFDNDDNFLRNTLTRIALVVVSTVILVWVLPKKQNTTIEFDYKEGTPWKGGTVIAKFNFHIYKKDSLVNLEREQVLKNFQPYYKIDKTVAQKALEEFDMAFTEEAYGELYRDKNKIANLLTQAYEKLIINDEERSKLTVDTIQIIDNEDNKKSAPTDIRNTLTTLQAYEYIIENEELAKHRDLLSSSNLNKYIRPNLFYDDVWSEARKEDIVKQSVAVSIGEVKEGEKIVDTGEVVTSEIADKLRSMVIEMERNGLNKQETNNLQIGQTLVVAILLILFTCYLIIFRKNYYNKPRHILMLYVMILVYPIIVSILVRHQHTLNSVYLLPFAMVPLLTRVFLDTRTAFITHVIMILICSLAVTYRFEFIIVEITGGLAAIYALSDLSKRAHLFWAAFLVAISTSAMYYAVQLIQNDEMIPVDSTIYLIFVINAILLLITYPMMFVIEKFFGFTSVVTLFELSDSSRGLLLKLSEVAPGTFTHSTTVGNLAYEIANKIGANGLLVRTGALYHDIGKMSNPVFFTENQAGINPHDKLTVIESAQIIIDHVKEGQRLAEKYNLPSNIKDFILTHHGQGVAKYFFLKYQKDHPNEDVDKSPFSYPGPNPFTREQAILMMTDSVEAASHSLKEYNEEAIRTLVNRIIDTQVNEGYFTECPITFLDIATAKQVLIDKLKSIYHTRIQYPGQEKPKENDNKESKLKRKKKRRRF